MPGNAAAGYFISTVTLKKRIDESPPSGTSTQLLSSRLSVPSSPSAPRNLHALKSGISEFLDAANVTAAAAGRIKVYYDCGQAAVTNLIHESMTARYGDAWDFAQDVRPDKYRLFQVADLVSYISLIERKQRSGIGLTRSEEKFFGGARNFRRNVLKPMFRKKI